MAKKLEKQIEANNGKKATLADFAEMSALDRLALLGQHYRTDLGAKNVLASVVASNQRAIYLGKGDEMIESKVIKSDNDLFNLTRGQGKEKFDDAAVMTFAVADCPKGMTQEQFDDIVYISAFEEAFFCKERNNCSKEAYKKLKGMNHLYLENAVLPIEDIEKAKATKRGKGRELLGSLNRTSSISLDADGDARVFNGGILYETNGEPEKRFVQENNKIILEDALAKQGKAFSGPEIKLVFPPLMGM
jgi:hypothetical protein